MRTESSVDFVDVLASVVFVGVGLTSLILALWPATATRYDEDALELVTTAMGLRAPPDELLVAGAALEDLIIAEAPWPDAVPQVPVRLVADDAVAQLAGDHYWVVARSGGRPEVPPAFHEEVLHAAGELALVEWRRSEASSGARLGDRMRTATARYRQGDTTRPCSAWRFGRLMCGPHEWNYVGVTEVPVSGRPELCIWAHPLSGSDLEVVFDDVQLRHGLRGRYAMADTAVADRNASPVTFRVLVDGEEQVKRVVPNRAGWNHFQLAPSPQREAPAPQTLTFVISATNDGRRHFCFDGEVGTPVGSHAAREER